MITKEKAIAKLLKAYHKRWDCFGNEKNKKRKKRRKK